VREWRGLYIRWSTLALEVGGIPGRDVASSGSVLMCNSTLRSGPQSRLASGAAAPLVGFCS